MVLEPLLPAIRLIGVVLIAKLRVLIGQGVRKLLLGVSRSLGHRRSTERTALRELGSECRDGVLVVGVRYVLVRIADDRIEVRILSGIGTRRRIDVLVARNESGECLVLRRIAPRVVDGVNVRTRLPLRHPRVEG